MDAFEALTDGQKVLLPDARGLFDALTAAFRGEAAAMAVQSRPGHTWDAASGALTITTNAGTTAWKTTGANASDVKTLVIEEDVITILDNAFSGCNWMTSAALPSTLQNID